MLVCIRSSTLCTAFWNKVVYLVPYFFDILCSTSSTIIRTFHIGIPCFKVLTKSMELQTLWALIIVVLHNSPPMNYASPSPSYLSSSYILPLYFTSTCFPWSHALRIARYSSLASLVWRGIISSSSMWQCAQRKM